MKNEKAIQNLREAKALIATYGWTTGTYGNCKRGFCTFGALAKVCDSLEFTGSWRWVGKDYLDKAARILVDDPYFDDGLGFTLVTYYNDVQAQDVEDIYKLFDKAIELAEAE